VARKGSGKAGGQARGAGIVTAKGAREWEVVRWRGAEVAGRRKEDDNNHGEGRGSIPRGCLASHRPQQNQPHAPWKNGRRGSK